jgi:ABC-type multidrug transport system ATPase subunit
LATAALPFLGSARLCHRVAIMDKGQLLALDTVPNLIASHGGASKIIADVEFWPKELSAVGPPQEGRKKLDFNGHGLLLFSQFCEMRGLASWI